MARSIRRALSRVARCVHSAVLAGSALARVVANARWRRVFQASCATCHTGAPDSRAPGLDALRARTPQAIIDSLVTGAMRPQGARLSGAERRAVAEFITGKSIEGDVSGAQTGRCTARAALPDLAKSPRWTGWSPSTTNTRFQPADQAGLAPSDLPRLTLKWAFGFPMPRWPGRIRPLLAGRVFVGSQNGTVYSLDAKTGCIHWTFSASGGVRTAVAVAPAGGARLVVYFGDTAANAYALDADTGRQTVDAPC